MAANPVRFTSIFPFQPHAYVFAVGYALQQQLLLHPLYGKGKNDHDHGH